MKSGGHFDKAEEALEDLLDDDSPLLEDMCSVIGEHENAVKRNRGMVLRLKASVRYRLSRRTRRTTGYYEIVRTMDENTQEAKDKFCNAFMAPSLNDCCLEPYFEKRTRNEFKRLELGAQSAFDESAPFAQNVKWMASTAPLFMISARETDHASLSNKLKVSREWQQGILAPVQTQSLEKWRQLLPLRVAKQEGIFDQPGHTRKFNNQYSTPGTKVSQVVKLVDKALQESQKSKSPYHDRRVSGLFLIWRSAQIRQWKLADTGQWSVDKMAHVDKVLVEKWALLPASQKTAEAIRKLAARATAPPPPASCVVTFAHSEFLI